MNRIKELFNLVTGAPSEAEQGARGLDLALRALLAIVVFGAIYGAAAGSMEPLMALQNIYKVPMVMRNSCADVDINHCHVYSISMDLSALIQAAAETLRGAPVPEDGRVRDVPDERTVRYYQSTGLVDRPLGYAGRSAVYGERHLLQLLCIKLLQARGLSISQIQRALAGATDAQLRDAVADGLGAAPATPGGAEIGAPTAPPPIVPGAPPIAAAQVAVEIAPGVLVIVDPRRVSDPAEVIHLLTLALNGARS